MSASHAHNADVPPSIIWQHSAGTTMPSTLRPSDFANPSARGSQTPTQRRFSKLAAGINQKWRRVKTRGVKLFAEDLAFVYIRDDGQCRYCGIDVGPMDTSFDHILPFKQGGPNVVDNLCVSCITCQRSKYTKTPAEYAEWQMLVRVCKTCQKQFRPRWADYKRGLGWYCSRKCSGAAAH